LEAAREYAERAVIDLRAELAQARQTIVTYDEVQQVCFLQSCCFGGACLCCLPVRACVRACDRGSRALGSVVLSRCLEPFIFVVLSVRLALCEGVRLHVRALDRQELLEELDVVKQNFTGFFSTIRPKIDSMQSLDGSD
jgi:hypothetical protein